MNTTGKRCSLPKTFTLKILSCAGLQNGHEKSGKTKKNDKSQVKMRVFEKIQKSHEKFFKKLQILSIQIYQIPYF